MNGKYFVGQFASTPGIYVVAEIVSHEGSSLEVKNIIQLFETGQNGLAVRPDPVFCVDKGEMDSVAKNGTYLNLDSFGVQRFTSNPEEPLIKQYVEKMAQVRSVRSGIIRPQSKIISPDLG